MKSLMLQPVKTKSRCAHASHVEKLLASVLTVTEYGRFMNRPPKGPETSIVISLFTVKFITSAGLSRCCFILWAYGAVSMQTNGE